MEGDLEKSRKQLMERGFIAKENFDNDPESKFNSEEYRKKVSYKNIFKLLFSSKFLVNNRYKIIKQY